MAEAQKPPQAVTNPVRDLDKSIATMRAFIAGKATIAAVGAALDGLDVDQLEVVGFAIRTPVSKLQALRSQAGAQAQLFT